jgi:hypothetical protein|tara:strand:- start:2 stop:289 length:288 start_codon:yes stop_codon:yes gene_type:complete
MIDIKDIIVGKSYACKFKVETMLDEMDRIPGLSDTPLKGVGTYEGIGVITHRDINSELVKLKDQDSGQEFVVGYDEIWDVDTVEWVDQLESNLDN